MEPITPPVDFEKRLTLPFRQLQDECIDPELDLPEDICSEEFWKTYAQKYGYPKIKKISWEESIDRATNSERNFPLILRISNWDLSDNPLTNYNSILLTTEIPDEGEFDYPVTRPQLSKIVFDKPVTISIEYDKFTINPDTPNGISFGHFLRSIYKEFWRTHEKGNSYIYSYLENTGPNVYKLIYTGSIENNKPISKSRLM